MVPSYLIGHLTDIKEKKDQIKATLISSTGNTELEIYFCGELDEESSKMPFIMQGEQPLLIVAKDPISCEEFVVFDQKIHGYDSMFCDEYDQSVNQKTCKYDFKPCKVEIKFGYGIDYEEEKDDYDFDESGKVIVNYGLLSWEEVKSIGYDWISLSLVDTKKKEIFEYELA